MPVHSSRKVYRGKRINPVTVTTANNAMAQLWSIHRVRSDDRLGTMIRHPSPGLARPVVSLACAMGFPTTFGSLVPLIGCTPLLPPYTLTAGGAAIALASVAMVTDEENRPTCTTSALPKNNLRHDPHYLEATSTLGNGGEMCAWRR